MNHPAPLHHDADAKLPAAAYLRYESRADGWSAGRQAAFLSHLADNGLVEDAARSVGMSVSGGYALRRTSRGYAFNLGWEAALIIARRVISDRLMTAAIKGEEARWVREEGVTTYMRQNTKLSLALLDRVNPATTLSEVMAVATRFDWYLQLIDEGARAQELWDLFFNDALPHSDIEARARVRASLLLSEESAGFGEEEEDEDEPPIEYKSMEGVVTEEVPSREAPFSVSRKDAKSQRRSRATYRPLRAFASSREKNSALRAKAESALGEMPAFDQSSPSPSVRPEPVEGRNQLPLRPKPSAPGAAAAFVPAGEPFIDKHAAQALPAARHDAQLAAIGIFIAVDAFKAEWPGIDQRVQPLRRLCAAQPFFAAARLMRFGGVDIGDADLGALIIEGVAIDHAIGTAAFMAKIESGAFHIAGRCGKRGGGGDAAFGRKAPHAGKDRRRERRDHGQERPDAVVAPRGAAPGGTLGRPMARIVPRQAMAAAALPAIEPEMLRHAPMLRSIALTDGKHRASLFGFGAKPPPVPRDLIRKGGVLAIV